MKVAANHWNEEQAVLLWSFMRGSDSGGGGNWQRCGDILAICFLFDVSGSLI